MTKKNKYNIKIAKNIKNILDEVGVNIKTQGIQNTPERVSKLLDFLIIIQNY